jgi:hypothetical protein
MKCKDAERQHPEYERARERERKEVRKGNRNYAGFLKERRYDEKNCRLERDREEHSSSRVFRMLTSTVDDECARRILDSENEDGETFIDRAMEDFLGASDFQEKGRWNDDDIRLSIGRILKERLNI